MCVHVIFVYIYINVYTVLYSYVLCSYRIIILIAKARGLIRDDS